MSTDAVFKAFEGQDSQKNLSQNQIKELPEEESINKSTLGEQWHTKYVDFKNSKLPIAQNVLISYWEKNTLNINHKHIADNLNFNILDTINQKIISGKLNIPDQEVATCETLIEAIKNRDYNKIQEENIKKHRLQEAKRIKLELKQKLKTVETDIQILNDRRFNSVTSKPRSLDQSAVNEEEHKKFILQKQRERSLLQKERRERQVKMKQKLEEDHKKQIEEQKKQEDEELAKRRQKIDEQLKKLKESQEERKKFQDIGNERYKEAIKSKPLYIERKVKYEKQMMLSLEEKKKSLAEIRKLQTPKLNVIQEHITNINQIHEQKEQERKENLIKHKRELRDYYKKPEYECELYQICQREKEEEEEEQEKKREARSLNNKKKEEFCEKIKKEFKPVPSKRLKRQFDVSYDVNSSNIFNDRVKQGKTHSELNRLGDHYMNIAKSKAKKVSPNQAASEIDRLETEKQKTTQTTLLTHKSTPTFLHQKYKDYNSIELQLEKVQKLGLKYQNMYSKNNLADSIYETESTTNENATANHNEDVEQKNIDSQSTNRAGLSQYKKNLKRIQIRSNNSMYQNAPNNNSYSNSNRTIDMERKELYMASDKLSQVAKQKEQLLNLNKKDDASQREEIANLYLGSIKAKLQLLNDDGHVVNI